MEERSYSISDDFPGQYEEVFKLERVLKREEEQNKKLLAENEMLKLHNKMHVENITRCKNDIIKLIEAVKEYFKLSSFDFEFNMLFDGEPEKHAKELKEKILSVISEIEGED